MTHDNSNTGEKRPSKKRWPWIVTGILAVLLVAGFFLYANFNRLLSEALLRNFNSSNISDVYELKFEDLSVNLLAGNIKVKNVELFPHEKPLRSYPYINTTFHLKTDKILLNHVEIFTLLRSNQLILERVEIGEPDVTLHITDHIPVLFPMLDSTAVKADTAKGPKKLLLAFSLKEFELVDAAFHVINTAREREFNVQKLNISLRDLFIEPQLGGDLISYSHIELSIAEATGKLMKESIKYVYFEDFRLAVDSLNIEKSLDTLIFRFADFSTGIRDVDIHTADSIFHLTLQSFQLSYRERSIKLRQLSFLPNISESAMQARYTHQNTQFAGSVGSMDLLGVQFDSLIYSKKLFVEEVVLDSVSASIFKDKTKPLDTSRFPEYLGQSVKGIPMPLLVKAFKVTHANLINRERNPDGSYATAHVNRATVNAKNITNLTVEKPLAIEAIAFLENKVHFTMALNFDYLKPEFTMSGKLDKFTLADLNPILEGYAPAAIQAGTVDEVTFAGTAYQTYSTGTMTFLYHDLAMDIAIRETAKWRNSVIAFAANSVVASSNPAADEPARVVQFRADRDMNKAFVNMVIKSVLAGIKETIVMSKENRKIHQQKVKEAKKSKKVTNE